MFKEDDVIKGKSGTVNCCRLFVIDSKRDCGDLNATLMGSEHEEDVIGSEFIIQADTFNDYELIDSGKEVFDSEYTSKNSDKVRMNILLDNI